MAKKLDMKPWAEAKAFPFADFNQPICAGSKRLGIDAFGHEKNLVERNKGTFFAPNPLERRSFLLRQGFGGQAEGFKMGYEAFDFCEIFLGGYNKL